METLYQINKEIFELRQQKAFTAALDVYKSKVHNHFPKEEIRDADFLVANVLFCLRKTGQVDGGFKFVHTTLMLNPTWEGNPQTCNEYGWLLYQYIKQLEPSKLLGEIPPHLLLAAELVKTIDATKDYLLFSLLFSELSKKLMQKGMAVELLITLFEAVPYTLFKAPVPHESNTMPDQAKSPEKASDLESYLVRKAKALLLAGNYGQCIEACRMAFEKIERFHHGNHVWIARNMAISLRQTGKTGEAIEQMEKILKKKKDWFLYQELAVMQLDAGMPEEALINISQAALQQGHSPYKAGLYAELAFRFGQYVEQDLICMHLWLALKTRQAENWSAPQLLVDAIENNSCKQTGLSPAELYGKLKPHWLKMSGKAPGNNQQVSGDNAGIHTEGTITRILNAGENGDGFITTKEGHSVYFRMKKVIGDQGRIAVGAKVKTFARIRIYKDKEVYNAMWVRMF